MEIINKKTFLKLFSIPMIPIDNINLTAQVTTFGDFMGWLYIFVLSVTAFLAVLMIVIGGVQMTVSGGSVQKRSDAKKRITQAIFGLLLAIGAFLILWTINPDLVTTGLNIECVGDCVGGGDGGGFGGGEGGGFGGGGDSGEF